MGRGLIGLVILAIAVAACWAVVAMGQAHAGAWIAAMIGPERAGSDAPMTETLFDLIVFGPLILIAVAASLIDRRNPVALGERPVLSLGVGLLVGLAGLCTCVLYARLAGVLTDAGPAEAVGSLLLWGFAVVALQVVAEEIYFRGWLQPALIARWGAIPGIVAGALAFGALHVAGAPDHRLSTVSLLNLFLGGLMFGLFAARGRGLAAAIGAHLAWNASEQLAWGLDPNPGIGSFGALADKELAGAALWGGSGEGLNGSVGMTIVLLAIVLPLAVLSWWRLPARSTDRPATGPATAAAR